MPVSVVVLAGGEATRFGGGKALATFRGEPLLLRVARRMLAMPGADDVVVASGPSARVAEYEAALAPLARSAVVVADEPRAGLGPAAGLATALERVAHEVACVAPCDAPLVDAAAYAGLLSALDEHAAAVYRTAGGVEPLHAAYRAAPAAAAFRRALAERPGAGARDGLRFLRVAEVEASGVPPTHFASANTRRDLDALAASDGVDAS